MIDDRRYTHKQFKASGCCRKGIKEWFDNNNIDYFDYLKNGITENEILNTKCAIGIKSLKIVKEYLSGEQG